jgi:hypothetical protein
MKNVYLGCDCGCRCIFAQDPVSGKEIGVAFGHGLGSTTLAYSAGHEDDLLQISVKDIAKDKVFLDLAREVNDAFDAKRRDIVETFYERVSVLVDMHIQRIEAQQKQRNKTSMFSSIKELFN